MALTVGETYNRATADSALAVPQVAGRALSSNLPLHICLLRPVLSGAGSGASAANSADPLAAALAAAGHHVQVLYLPGPHSPAQTIRFWTNHYRNMGIDFAALPDMPAVRVGPAGPAQTSYRLLQFLLSRQDRLNLVHLPLWPGVGYHSMLAKHQGWAFQHTRFVVGLDHPAPRAGSDQPSFLHQVEELEAAFMQRQMVSMADALWSTQPQAAAGRLNLPPDADPVTIEPACDQTAGTAQWLRWHDRLLAKCPDPVSTFTPKDQAAATLVSVCICHFNRPLLLARALESIRNQDYPHLEVVVCDDGSTDPAAIGFLNSLEPEFAVKDWQIIRQNNRYLGAARNTAARAARGEYLLFMDDDDVAQSDEISVFMRVARHTGADILTCSMERFSSLEPPAENQPPRNIQVFLGPAVAAGAFRNVFGPANALIRRQAMELLGGFGEDYGVGFEDWEFFARAVLRGFHLQTIPRRLFWYRMNPSGMCGSTDPHAARLRIIQPYLQAAPAPLRELLLYAHGTYHTWQSDAALPWPHGLAQTPQAFVDRHWQSASWRSTRIFRDISARLGGHPSEARPIVHTAAAAWEVVNRMQQSISWNITGPFRALRRLLRRHRWPLYIFILLAACLSRPLGGPACVRAGDMELGCGRHCLRRAKWSTRRGTPCLQPH